MKNKLDFICIGATKSATTTLFDLIKYHPQIYIPSDKEVPYFSDDNIYKKGWEQYIKTFFDRASDKHMIGTISPQYMTGINAVTPDKISERIYNELPDIKLIVLLRQPVSRAYSHYKMHKRNSYINETFESAVNKMLGSNLDTERDNLSPRNIFFLSSEYGRILESYYKRFPKNNILVLYTENLKKDPYTVLEQVFNFLKIDSDYRPKDIARQSHKGGSAKIKYFSPAYLEKMPPINFLWKKFVPVKLRKKIFMKVTRWNIKSDNDRLDPDSQIYKKLVKYFNNDVKLLESETGTKVPWEEWR